MNYAGRKWWYTYRKLFDLCSERRVEKVSGSVLAQYANLTKSWDISANSAWTCRTYLATKMILNATVLTNALKYSEVIGLRIANPYYEYYAALSLMRAVVYTLPSESWSDGELISISHSKAINLTFDWLAKFDHATAERLRKVARQLKAQREVISYRAPASGTAVLDEEYDLNELLVVLGELAQFNSELLEQSVSKNASPDCFVVQENSTFSLIYFEIEGFVFNDSEDTYRLGYIARKQPRPYSLAATMTEGQTEDFIGAWDSIEEEKFTNGSPCAWQQIFDIP